MGLLRAQGRRVQWERVRSSMHRVDSASIVSRMSQLRCVVRRTYSVPSPKSLMHIDTNHKLIGHNIVIFGGIDGFSRKVSLHLSPLSCDIEETCYVEVLASLTTMQQPIMYLHVTNNNLASTTLAFFSEAVQNFGLPLRVWGGHGVENVDAACFMFSVQGTGKSSFIAGKSVHNQRIEVMAGHVHCSHQPLL
ncbi:hypothetical protein GJAV_G00016940 [Gymnothorax javanicus]|nr:hypothetical protein GJAV_G00016940 [Gymnothorax javanicus]